jgi:WD40 repeat protein
VYSEPLQSHALHIYRSAYVTMPHCPLLDAPAQARVPHLKHSLISPRAAHWGSLEPILEAGGVPHGVAVSHDGLMIVAGSSSGLLRVWTTANCEEVAQLSGHEGQVWSVAWSSDGLRFASSSQDRTIRVWDGRTFETLGLCMHDDEVNSVAFSPDNSLITSGSDDRTVRIWNAVSCEEVACLTGHNHIVRSVAFFPDGTRIASVSDDSAVRIWDTRTYEVLSGIQCSGNAYVVAVSPDSTRLAMIANSGVTDTLHLYDVVTLAQQAQVNVSAGYSTPWACAFSPDDNSIAIGTGAGAVQIWDARDLSHISTTRRHHGQVCSIAFSPDGSKLVSGSRDATVRIRPVSSSEEQFASIPGHYELVTQVVFSSDGSHLVSGSWDKTVRIWDGLTYEELAVLSGHNGAVLTVAYSPDGTRVASGSVDNTMCVWNTSTFQPIAILEGHKASVGFVTFAPDGALIASGSDDRTVRLWSSSTLQELARLEGHTAEVWFLAFSPASTRLASISKDNTLRVWDAIGFTQLAVLEARVPHRYLSSLVFSSDGKAVWTRHGDGPAWVSDDKHDCERCFDWKLFHADIESPVIWTAVPLATAIGTQIRNTEPVLNGDGWLDHKTESGTSRIWLPAERRGRQMAVASSGSQIVIGAIGGAMTMLDLSQ